MAWYAVPLMQHGEAYSGGVNTMLREPGKSNNKMYKSPICMSALLQSMWTCCSSFSMCCQSSIYRHLLLL